MRLIYLNMKGLPNIDRFKCLSNDINLMSADVICISNTTSSDNFSVILKEFDIIYNTQELVDDKSMGMIIYKKQHIDLISVQPYKDTYYQSVICQFKQGYICFIYLDEDRMSFEVTKLMEKLNDYSVDTSILSIIAGLKSHSIENNDNSVNFFKIVKKLFVKTARRKIMYREIDFIFVNEGLQP